MTAAPAGAEETRELIRLANEAYRAGEYQECIKQYGTAFEQGLQESEMFYNAACCCALGGRIDQAFIYLDEAVELGYDNIQWLEQDTDLQSLRSDNRWTGLVERCEAAHEVYLQSINRELYGLYQEDQGDRLTDFENIDWSTVHKRDAEHRARVREMLDSGQVVTADDYYHAAMIFQHGDDTTAYLLARELALKAVELDSTNNIARWLAAAAKDRYLWHVGKPQWYGTQTHMLDGKWTIEPIDTTVVTDEERREWRVPDLAEARRRAEQMNEPKKP